MANTGYKINPKLKKVSNDINEYPLDINNNRISDTGLPQASLDNSTDSINYKEDNPNFCSATINNFIYSVNWDSNPFTESGIIFENNGIEVGRTETSGEVSNVLNGVFSKNSMITIKHSSQPDIYPWEIGMKVRIVVKINNVVVRDILSSTQYRILDTFNLQSDSSIDKVEVIVTAEGTTTNRLTRTLDTYLFYSDPNQLNVKIFDNTDNLYKLNVFPLLNGNRIKYNINNGVDTLTIPIKNTGATTRYIYIEGDGFTDTATINPNSIYTIIGVPKSGNIYLFDVEGPGYVRRGEFTRNNCGNGYTGGNIVFVKSYIDEATASADTTNFNALGQARANSTGSCTINP